MLKEGKKNFIIKFIIINDFRGIRGCKYELSIVCYKKGIFKE